MLVIGLAGGVASGKSLVARCFEQLGAIVLDADAIGHEVLREPEIIAAIVEHWGENVIRNGEIDRSALARIVFDSKTGDATHLTTLEQITHPRISQKIRDRLDELDSESGQAVSPSPAVVLDAPVMFKAGWDQMCDKVVFVEAAPLIRQQRIKQRGWSNDELAKRETFQTSLDEKRKRSTDFIDNSRSKQDTYNQVLNLWQQWNLQMPNEPDSPTTLFSN